MAIRHAKPGELVDLQKWPSELDAVSSHALIDNDSFRLDRIVLAKGQSLPERSVASPIIIQCVTGILELRTSRARQSIGPSQLVHLLADDPHELEALADSIALLTILG